MYMKVFVSLKLYKFIYKVHCIYMYNFYVLCYTYLCPKFHGDK